MEKYINQLLTDLEEKILNRWNEQPPHFYGTGMPNMYIEPPEGWNEDEYKYLKAERPKVSFETQIAELEAWMDQAEQDAMFYKFGLSPEEFPPPSRLTENQLQAIVLKLLRLWAAYNFSVLLPEKLPFSLRYETLLKRMLKGASFIKYGHVGIEFCHYEPNDCPFPLEYCSCKDEDDE